jgi:hypothetical protein
VADLAHPHAFQVYFAQAQELAAGDLFLHKLLGDICGRGQLGQHGLYPRCDGVDRPRLDSLQKRCCFFDEFPLP